MPVNIDDIKKLPTEEKLKIINEIWESIEENWDHTESDEESPEVIAMLEERLNAYEKGDNKSYTWEEVKERIIKNIEQQRNNKK